MFMSVYVHLRQTRNTAHPWRDEARWHARLLQAARVSLRESSTAHFELQQESAGFTANHGGSEWEKNEYFLNISYATSIVTSSVPMLIASIKSKCQTLIQMNDRKQLDKSQIDQLVSQFQKVMIDSAIREFRPKLKSFEI